MHVQEFVERVNQLTHQSELFEYQKKQNGTATLKLPVLYQQDLLLSTYLRAAYFTKVFAYVWAIPSSTNFKHYLSQEKLLLSAGNVIHTCGGDQACGMIPAPFKIAIYTTHANAENACTERFWQEAIVSDVNSPWFDRVLTISKFLEKGCDC